MSSFPTYGQLPTQIDPLAWGGRTTGNKLTVDSIQDQIANYLNLFFTGATQNPNLPPLPIRVYVYPEFDLDTWWQGNDIAFVLISYIGTTYGKPISTSSMVQERTLQYKVHVEARTNSWKLRGDGSVYALIEAIEQGLSGFQPVGCRRAYFTEERFSEQDSEGRVWLHDMLYNVVTLRPRLLPAYTLADLQKVTYNVEPSGEVINVPDPNLPELG
jgi:hypothetical protein